MLDKIEILKNGITITRKVAFHETDAAGVAHFSHLLCYAEEAEHALLASCGIPILSPTVGYPRVAMQAEFEQPARFASILSVRIWLANHGNTSYTWHFAISLPDDTIICQGQYTTVRVER